MTNHNRTETAKELEDTLRHWWIRDANLGDAPSQAASKLLSALFRYGFAITRIAPPPPESDLLRAAKKVAEWFEKQAAHGECEAKICRFESLKVAYAADARNYKAMAKDLRAAIQSAEGDKP